ncbi:unnamed protein product [Urochloa humidicola]
MRQREGAEEEVDLRRRSRGGGAEDERRRRSLWRRHLRRPPPQPPAARPAKSDGDSEDSASIKRATEVSRGDIVVFRSLMNHHELVIALPEDWI